MKTLSLDGKTYRCPLSDRFRRHTADERERMDEAGDIEYPVLLYKDTTLKLDHCVLDGEGRLETATRTGNLIAFRHVGEFTTDEAYERAKQLNDARRHDDPDSIRKRRAERVERVAEKRAEGKSTRQIAEEEGVSQPQVLRDLKTATDTGVSVEPPEQVTGKDGKKRAAKKKPKDKPASEEKAAPPAERNGKHEPATEPESPPADPGDEFVQRVETLCRQLDKFNADVTALKADRFSYSIHLDTVLHSIKAARTALWQGRPAHPCPYCEVNEKQGCKACGGTMRVKRTTYDSGREAVGGAA